MQLDPLFFRIVLALRFFHHHDVARLEDEFLVVFIKVDVAADKDGGSLFEIVVLVELVGVAEQLEGHRIGVIGERIGEDLLFTLVVLAGLDVKHIPPHRDIFPLLVDFVERRWRSPDLFA